MNSDSLFFLMLGIIYFALLLQGLFRLKNTNSLAPSLRNSFIFYLSIIFQTLLRVISNTTIAVYYDKMTIREALLLLYIPTTIFTLSFLLLVWQMLTVFIQAHIRNSGSFTLSFLGQMTTSPKHSKVTGYIVFFLTIWIGMQTVLYFAFAADKLSSRTLVREVIISGLIVGVSILVLIIVLEFKFSSVPIRNETWRKRTRKIKFIALYWTITKIVRELTILIADSITFQVGEEISSGAQNNINTLCIYFVLSLITEIFPVFLVQDYEFIEIFMFSDEEEATSEVVLVPVLRKHTIKTGKRNLKFTMVAENPFKTQDEINIIQSFEAQPNKLGKLYKASFNNSLVLYRKITFTRLSTYVVEEFIGEIDSYKEILTENIIPVLGIILNQPIVGLISPYFPNGSMYKHLHIQKTKFAWKKKIEMAITISEALEEIHSIPRAHGHLSSHNILFDENMSPNISDLGFNKVKKYAGLMNEYTNLSAWSSPEILRDRRVTPLKAKSSDDSYSFGMILWELATESIPFEGMGKEALYEIIVMENSRPSIENVPREFGEIIYKCWNPDPSQRPSLVDITEMLERLN